MGGFSITFEKVIAGLIASILSVFIEDLLPLFLVTVVFEATDFITGIWKSYVLAKRRKEKFAFESVKAWRTIYKMFFIVLGIMLMELLDSTLSEEGLRFANYFTGFCCGVEFWSFLENAAVISEHPVFRWLRKYMKGRVEDGLGADFDEITKMEGSDENK